MLSDTLVIDDTMKGEGHVFKRRERQSRKRKKKIKRLGKKENYCSWTTAFVKHHFYCKHPIY